MTAIGDIVPRYWSQSHCVPSRSSASVKLSFKTYCSSASSESKEGEAVACGFANKLADNREREGCCPSTTREPDAEPDDGGWSRPLGLGIVPVDGDERATSLQLLCPVMEVMERVDKPTLLLARKAGGVDDVEAGNENDTETRSPTDADALRLPLALFPKDSAPGCDGICRTFNLPMLSGDIDTPILLEPASVGSGLWRGDTCIFVDPAGE